MHPSTLGATAAALLLAATPALAAGDPIAGKAAFGQCAACHSPEAGQTRMGPSLFGVVGRPAGSLAGYNYSPAMAKSGLKWTPGELDKFLTAPRQVVPGTRMFYAGQADAKVRADLIAYLGTLR